VARKYVRTSLSEVIEGNKKVVRTMGRSVGSAYTEYISTRELPFVEAATPSTLAFHAGTEKPNDTQSIHAL
jgi:hypothetical protein